MKQNPRDQDFIEREQQLPPDFASLPPDASAAGSAVTAFQQARSGQPLDDYSVRSIYDSRPVSAFDVNLIQSKSVAPNASTVIVQLDFLVPAGYVLVPREIHHWGEPDFGQARSDVTLTLAVNRSPIPGNINIPVGSASDDLVKFFQPVDQGSTFSLLFTIKAGVVLLGSTLFGMVYGNFIPRTGSALPYQIANPSKTPRNDSIGPTVPAIDPTPG